MMLKLAGRHFPGKAESRPPGLRLQVQMDSAGQVRIEQLAHSRSAGWYIQKTLRVPAEALPALITELRKAQCVAPHAASHALLNSPAHTPELVTRPFHPLEKKARANAWRA